MTGGPAPALVVLDLATGGRGAGALGRVTVATGMQGPVETVACEQPPAARLAEMGRLGVRAVHLLGGAGVAEVGWEELADSVAALAVDRGAGAVLLDCSPTGRDVAGRLAARLDAAAVVEVMAIGGGEQLTAVSSALGGTADVTTAFGPGRPIVLLVRGGAPAGDAGAAAPGAAGTLPPVLLVPPVPSGPRRARLLRRDPSPVAAGPSLEEARVVFCQGAGVRGAETVARLREAAAMVGAAIGATRAAIDAGSAHPSQLVGQSGVSVAPDVCVCWGVSGAPQHLAGVRGARHLVAVNRNPDAPIFRHADLGVVGDVRTVLDQLLAELRFRATWRIGDGPSAGPTEGP